MFRATRASIAACVAIGCAAVVPLCAKAQDPTSGVVSVIQNKYPVTELTPDRQQVISPGVILTVRCPGIYSEPGFGPDNRFVGGGKIEAGAMAKLMYTKSTHIIQPGEKVYLTKVEGKAEAKDDMIKLSIVTVDALDVPGEDGQKRYAATITGKYKKGAIEELSPEQISQGFEACLAPDTGTSPGAPQQSPPPSYSAPQQQAVAPQPAPAPAAPAPPPATITIGESSTQVLQAMGMPQQMIDLGKKKTYVYKNMKIIFVDDKVSDVQ